MKIFIDTSAWVALESKKDVHYEEAMLFKEEIKNKQYRLYTSNFVLDETYTLLLANIGYERAIESAKKLRTMKDKGLLHVVRVIEEIEESAWEIFERFNRDKFWSFTDCTSKIIMELLGIKEAFSFDRNFEQMGFLKKP
jgi:predicted nucleic acid-binding protein